MSSTDLVSLPTLLSGGRHTVGREDGEGGKGGGGGRKSSSSDENIPHDSDTDECQPDKTSLRFSTSYGGVIDPETILLQSSTLSSPTTPTITAPTANQPSIVLNRPPTSAVGQQEDALEGHPNKKNAKEFKPRQKRHSSKKLDALRASAVARAANTTIKTNNPNNINNINSETGSTTLIGPQTGSGSQQKSHSSKMAPPTVTTEGTSVDSSMSMPSSISERLPQMCVGPVNPNDNECVNGHSIQQSGCGFSSTPSSMAAPSSVSNSNSGRLVLGVPIGPNSSCVGDRTTNIASNPDGFKSNSNICSNINRNSNENATLSKQDCLALPSCNNFLRVVEAEDDLSDWESPVDVDLAAPRARRSQVGGLRS